MTDIQNPLGEHPASKTESCGLLGNIIAVSGSTASVGMLPTARGRWCPRTVSKFVMIYSGRSQVVGLVTGIIRGPASNREAGYGAIAESNQMGGRKLEAGKRRGRSGIRRFCGGAVARQHDERPDQAQKQCHRTALALGPRLSRPAPHRHGRDLVQR